MALKCTVEDLREVEVIRNRAVIYARYSSDKQKEASIEQQVKECSDYIARKGYSLIRVYSDSAKSASHDVEKRSDFLKLIEDAEYGEFDVVVSYALDRISREEHGGFYGYENALNRNGVRIEYATQVFDDGYGGEISKAVHVTMASEYVAQLRKNVVRGMRDNVKNGRFNGGSAVPIGLKVVGEGKKSKRYAVDETTSPFVKQAFDMYLAGMTTGEIMQFLNDNGVRTSRGSKVNRDTVNRILANPIYIGTKVSVFNNKVEHKVYTTEGVVDPIVSEDVWERVQIMRESRQHKGAAEPARKRYILRGKLFCGLCGTEMITESGRSANGNKYCYYICERRKHGKGDERCRKQNVPKDAIEEAVLAIVTQRIWSDYQIDEYVRAAKEAIRLHEEDPRIVQLKSEIKRHTEKKKRAMQCYLDTDDPEWYDLSKEESRLIKECEAELAIRIRQDNAPKEAEDFLAELENIAAAWDTMLQSDEGRQNIIQTYVERIDIFDPEPDDPGKCRIDLLIRTDPGAECAERIQSEVECAVRNCEKEVHHQKAHRRVCFLLFAVYKNRTRIEQGDGEAGTEAPGELPLARVRAGAAATGFPSKTLSKSFAWSARISLCFLPPAVCLSPPPAAANPRPRVTNKKHTEGCAFCYPQKNRTRIEQGDGEAGTKALGELSLARVRAGAAATGDSRPGHQQKAHRRVCFLLSSEKPDENRTGRRQSRNGSSGGASVSPRACRSGAFRKEVRRS